MTFLVGHCGQQEAHVPALAPPNEVVANPVFHRAGRFLTFVTYILAHAQFTCHIIQNGIQEGRLKRNQTLGTNKVFSQLIV